LASLWNRASIVILDNAGNIAKVAVLVAAAVIDPGTGVISAIASAIAAVTSGTVVRTEVGQEASVTGAAAVASDYGSVEDRMTLTYTAADGSTGTFEVPTPVDTDFGPGDRVNMADDSVANLVTLYNSLALSPFGQTITINGGIRTRKKQMKV
jgi:hypothetical protein